MKQRGGKKIDDPDDINKNGAWRIVNEIFYSRKESKLISGPEERNDRLFDYMHSSGTSFIGLLLIILIGIFIGCHFGYRLFNLKSIVLIILPIIHLCEYRTARENAHFFLEAVLTNELYSYKKKNKKKLRLYITKGDIKRNKRRKYMI